MTEIADVLETMMRQLVVLKELLAARHKDSDTKPDDESYSIAEQITTWRQAHDWTQEELASKLGTSQPVISMWEDPQYLGYSISSLKRLADVFGTKVIVQFAQDTRRTSAWQSIDTAPKDGRAILLLSIPVDLDMRPNGLVHQPARVAIGHWDADGTSWVDEMGRLDGEAYAIAGTGVWFSGYGWFQPNEVSHWMPLPEPPKASA